MQVQSSEAGGIIGILIRVAQSLVSSGHSEHVCVYIYIYINIYIHKYIYIMRGISWLTEKLLASEEGPCSVELCKYIYAYTGCFTTLGHSCRR